MQMVCISKMSAAKTDNEVTPLHGERVTSQRLLILRIIREGEGHMDAEELYRRATEEDPRISLSTIYRNLRLFKRIGLVEERYLGEGHHHYELRRPTQHHHLVCLGCGRVIEFECPQTEQMREDVAKANDFEITDTEVYFAGYCSSCRKKRG